MAEKGIVIVGPWGADSTGDDAEGCDKPGKMTLGFVVSECARQLGHEPTPRELARWANYQEDGRGEYCLFGRAITTQEAAVILRHPAREVTVRPERRQQTAGPRLVRPTAPR